MLQLAQEAAGLWTCEVIRPNVLPSRPVETAVAVKRFLDVLRSGEREPPLCLLCDFEFWPARVPFAFVCLRSYRHHASIASLSGLCPSCAAADDDELHTRTIAVLRTTLLPDARRLNAAELSHGQAGSA